MISPNIPLEALAQYLKECGEFTTIEIIYFDPYPAILYVYLNFVQTAIVKVKDDVFDASRRPFIRAITTDVNIADPRCFEELRVWINEAAYPP